MGFKHYLHDYMLDAIANWITTGNDYTITPIETSHLILFTPFMEVVNVIIGRDEVYQLFPGLQSIRFTRGRRVKLKYFNTNPKGTKLNNSPEDYDSSD